MEANVSVVAQNANNEDLVSINTALNVSARNAAVDIKGVIHGLICKMLSSEEIMGTFNLGRYAVSKIADCEVVNDKEIRVDICTEKNDMIKHSATLGPRPNDVPHDNSIHLNIHVQFE